MEKKKVYLPEDVIKEILLRLPVRSVLRCKCVCKLWLSIISRPHFANSHFQLASSPTHKLVIFEDFNPFKALTIDFNASLNHDSAYHSLSLDFLPHCSDPDIIGSCRGFLLLDYNPCLYLWNPSTGVNKQIPLSPITVAGIDADSDYILKFLYGLTYEPSTDDYLVVLGSYQCDDDYDRISSSLDLEIFSLKANNWKQIQVASHFPYEIITCSANGLTRVGLFLNGAIHWLVYNYETGRDVIIAFDLKEMTMSEIALPDDFDFRSVSPLDFDVLVLNGLIGVWISDMDETVEIWVMQEYAVHSSWTFFMHPAPQDYCFSLGCFTSCGDVVGTDLQGGLKKFNNKGQLLEHLYYGHRLSRERNQMAVYTESLLSLPSDTD